MEDDDMFCEKVFNPDVVSFAIGNEESGMFYGPTTDFKSIQEQEGERGQFVYLLFRLTSKPILKWDRGWKPL
jgi:hypothetical protein